MNILIWLIKAKDISRNNPLHQKKLSMKPQVVHSIDSYLNENQKYHFWESADSREVIL